MTGSSPDRSLATRASLLRRLRDCQDQAGWQEFYDRYRDLIWRFALKAGCTETEADDVVQETVISVARKLPQFTYDPARCSFKTWLLNVSTWRVRDQFRKRAPAGRETSAAHSAASAGTDDTSRANPTERVTDSADGLEALWEAEWEQALAAAAMQRVKQQANLKDCQMFDLYVLRGQPAREVARALGVSVARVYLAKHRIAPQLRKEILALEQHFQ